MTYKIARTDGTVITTLLDGTTDTSTGLTLIGRNVPSYGLLQNENFVKLLENFADTIPPNQSSGPLPLSGSLWWDTGNQILKVYNGSNYITVSQQTSSSTAPFIKAIGDQWWDTVTQQLKIWTGNAWMVVGPAYTAAQGLSGAVVDTVAELGTSNLFTVVSTYVNGKVISVLNPNRNFVIDTAANTAYFGFATLATGQTVLPSTILHNTANNSITVGGFYPTQFARLDVPNTLVDTTVNGQVNIKTANLVVIGSDFNIVNSRSSGGINFNVTNSGGHQFTALSINSLSGELGVNYTNPTGTNSLATKAYVDSTAATLVSDVITSQQNIQSTVNGVISDYQQAITNAEASVAASLAATTQQLNNSYNTLNQQVTSTNAIVFANLGRLYDTSVSSLSAISTRLPTNSPTITTTDGPATVTGPHSLPPQGDNSSTIAVTAYVDAGLNALKNSLSSAITSAVGSATTSLGGQFRTYAPLDSPVFIGNPRSDAQPPLSPTDASDSIATTAFVQAAIAAIPSVTFKYTVSPNTPSGGNDGDFWFQTG